MLLEKIKVTKKDIENGDGGNRYSCPVANSIRRNLPGKNEEKEVIVDGLWLRMHTKVGNRFIGKEFYIRDNLRNWIKRFDTNREVGEITIEFDGNWAKIV